MTLRSITNIVTAVRKNLAPMAGSMPPAIVNIAALTMALPILSPTAAVPPPTPVLPKTPSLIVFTVPLPTTAAILLPNTATLVVLRTLNVDTLIVKDVFMVAKLFIPTLPV